MVLMTIFCIVEPIRLAAGWYGNLQENVSPSCKGLEMKVSLWQTGAEYGHGTSSSLQLPWLILYIILTWAPQQAAVLYCMLAAIDIDNWTTAVQYAQAIIMGVGQGSGLTSASVLLTYELYLPCVPQFQCFVGIYAAIRMSRLQKQQFAQFEYVMNQRLVWISKFRVQLPEWWLNYLLLFPSKAEECAVRGWWRYRGRKCEDCQWRGRDRQQKSYNGSIINCWLQQNSVSIVNR